MKHISTCLLLAALALLTACTPRVPDDARAVGRPARIVPDNGEAVLPPNIAPLNFRIEEEGSAYVVRLYTDADPAGIVIGGRTIDIPVKAWHRLLEGARGGLLHTDIYVRGAEGWQQFATRTNAVAEEGVDPYITYRLIQPSYVDYEDLTLIERNVTNWDERVLFSNRMLSDGDDGQCINCHAPRNYNRGGQSQFHVRQKFGGTVFISGEQVSKVNLKTDSTLSAGVYASWHPTLPLVAFSVNKTGQIFHTRSTDKIEVIDYASDLVLYNTETNQVQHIDARDDQFETFPCWSPDGGTLYYASARYEADAYMAENDFEGLHYNIYSRPYDAATGLFGRQRLLFDADSIGKSVAFPRVSPDGRWLLFSMGRSGQFHVWHSDADLFVLDLQSGTVSALEAANSPRMESYHAWSSNGRWILFTSRRTDANYTRLYLSYFDEDGQAHTPLLLPQRDPRHDERLLRSYNVPEWMVQPVQASLIQLTEGIRRPALQAEYAGSALAAETESEAAAAAPSDSTGSNVPLHEAAELEGSTPVDY